MEKTDDIAEAEDDADVSKIRMAARELNRGKEPQSLNFFSGGEKEGVECFAFARHRLRFLKDEKEKFIKYLTTLPFGPQILSKNNIKIHLETVMFYVNNRTTGESLYKFIQIQQNNNKKLLKVKLNIDGDLEYYFNEILSNIENDEDNLRTNSISKFLFYNFNTLRVSGGKKPLLLRHSNISDDEFALERLQSKSWSYFIDTLIEISNDDMKYGEAIKNEAESDIMEKTIDNLDYYKNTYNRSYDDVAKHFKVVLEHMQRRDTEIIQNHLNTKIYRAFDIVDNPKVLEVLQLFGRYYFKTGTFPTGKNLAYVPEGEMPSFLNANENTSPNLLFKKFNTIHVYGLVSTQFLCALHIFVGGEKELSKNAMSKFFNNLSMQVLYREDDTAEFNFEHAKNYAIT